MRPLLLGVAYSVTAVTLDRMYGIEAGALFSLASIVGLVLWWAIARPSNKPTI